jgi:hypothetical protein
MAFVSLCEMSPVRTGTPLLLLCAKFCLVSTLRRAYYRQASFKKAVFSVKR